MPATKTKTRRESIDRAADVKSAPLSVDGLTRHGVLLLLVLSTALLKSLIFVPIGIWPLAFVCMVPWLVMVGGSSRAPRVYVYSFLLGMLFYSFNVRWMIPATGYGYIALAFYLAVYFPFSAVALRHVIRRRRWPLALGFPLIWVGCEMIRAVALSGFPWFFLSHSLFGVRVMIQVADLVGAYGVTFCIASVNGVVADLLLRRLHARGTLVLEGSLPSPRWGVVGCVVCVAFVLSYGSYRLSQAYEGEGGTLRPGPRVALIQGDFLDMVNQSKAQGHDKTSGRDRMFAYLGLMTEASAESPDVFLLPESPWRMVLNAEARGLWTLSRESYSQLQQIATRNEAHIVTGCTSYEKHAFDLNMVPDRFFNSAAVFYPDGRELGRYDKNHLVYFGETVPFRFTRLHWLYLKLNALMPFSGPDGTREFSLFRGTEFSTFAIEPKSMSGSSSEVVRFGIPICYEDVMPYVSRRFVDDGSGGKRVDMLLNISNDGWFGRGIQQPQHLAICAFRAVENRVGIARSVNTGVSAFIDPTGRIYGRTSDPNDNWPGRLGFSVDRVLLDSRVSFYTGHGDWFAWACVLSWALLFLDYWVQRIRHAALSAREE